MKPLDTKPPRCPVCDREVKLAPDGEVETHFGTHMFSGRPVLCPGSDTGGLMIRATNPEDFALADAVNKMIEHYLRERLISFFQDPNVVLTNCDSHATLEGGGWGGGNTKLLPGVRDLVAGPRSGKRPS